ncbi:MAG: ABC transporter ATP-binding protein [Sedimentisphaerales bacterium]|nr:ABC transporter ATP-binding protein [Sedimentisphaerales bacterium]
MSSRLHLSKIEVKRRGRVILDIDNLEIQPGEFVGVIGPNGAGKSTLLKVCCGLIKPNTGTATFENIDWSLVGSWTKSNFRKRIGYVPQAKEYNANLPFTLREVVAMGRASVKPLFSPLNEKDHAIIESWISRLGLTSQKSQTFRSLSGGEQQKVLIARAMVQNPVILMLDEPGANLDFTSKYELRNLINDLYEQTKVTILMVSHEIELLPRSCKRVILLHEGKVVADGSRAEVLTEDVLTKVYHYPLKVVEIGGYKYTTGKDGN